MPEYRFDVLCMNDNTCDIVMNGMREEYHDKRIEKIIDPKHRDQGDHYVQLTCADIDEADQKSREMVQRYSTYIRTITVKPL